MKSRCFSVLMSLYYKESPSNLYACLDSLANQTVQAGEIVLVIDGEISDELMDVINFYKNTLPLKIYPLSKNVGLGNALNYGLGFCSNELVARMDTDDICLPVRFERQIKLFNDNDSLSMISSAIIEFDEDGNERLKVLPSDMESIKKFSVYKNPFNHMSVMFKKSIVVKLGGYIHHLYMEDYNLWLRMIANGCALYNDPTVLVRARVNRSTLLKRRGWIYIKSELLLFKEKNRLGITQPFIGALILIMRSLPRVLPLWILNVIYSYDRSK